VPAGGALERAQALAAEIAAFPQVCVRSDRASALEQWGLSEDDALAAEFRHGLRAVEAEAVDGATRFAEGAGRHGAF
jgi:hypothetical protein